MKNIGGIWKQISKKSGKPYLEIKPDLLRALKMVDPEAEKVLIFQNQKRPDKKDPDYSVTVVSRTQGQSQPGQYRNQNQPSNNWPSPPQNNNPPPFDPSDDIPF